MLYALILSLLVAPTLQAKVPRPKLIVVLVFDQFRADYLTRFESRFVAAKQGKKVGGFKFLMEHGAYYPFAQYSTLQNMTCPGHATILTGAHPYQHGITTNDWFDKKTGEKVYCVEDREIEAVGARVDDKHAGTSPRNLIGTTVGDELKNAGLRSKVVTIALKDRAAILLGGHRADLALWYHPETNRWISSRHYLPEGQLPRWLEAFNLHLQTLTPSEWQALGPASGRSLEKNEFLKSGPIVAELEAHFPHAPKDGKRASHFLPYGAEMTVSLAERALNEMHLGQGHDTDLLALSFSGHDSLGHAYGPNSREMEEMTVFEDQMVSRLLNAIDKKLGLRNVVIALTGDHGVSAVPEWLKSVKIPAGRIDEPQLQSELESHLTNLHGKGPWISGLAELGVWLNRASLREARLDVAQVQAEVVEFVRASPELQKSVAHVFSGNDVRQRTLPAGLFETQIRLTFSEPTSADVILIPRPHFIMGTGTTSHVTGYTYDRTVPLILFGSRFRAGEYAQGAQVVDLATTLSFVAGTMAPSGAEGRVLHEALMR